MKEGIDLGLKDEIICLIQELHEMESHAIKSFLGTRDEKYLKVLNKTRELRTKWMQYIFIEEPNSQKWCLEKHSFSASKRATEVATKFLSMGETEKAKECLLDSGEIMGMYYFLDEPKDTPAQSMIKKVYKGLNL